MKKRSMIIAPAATFVAVITHGAVAGDPVEDPIPESPVMRGPVQLESLATGLTAPNWGTFAPGYSETLLVTDQNGILWAIDLESGDKSVFLDVSDRLVELGIAGPDTFDERGLLGVAFHPDYDKNGLFYTYTSEPVDGPADFTTMPPGIEADHHTVITEWEMDDPSDALRGGSVPSDRVLLRIDQPQFNHDGGAINFGPDGMLYIALGDGGAADDQGDGHSPGGNGQDTTNILGNMLRIDPQGVDSSNGQYGIPPDNPFVGQKGFLDEIYAYGFRNPFRFSFDMDTGRMIVADVGQNDLEEVTVIEAGDNAGWPHKEGSFFFDPNGDGPGFVTDQDPGGLPLMRDPIAEYDHDEGIAIIGGFVYRGDDIPRLQGRYVFGEFAKTFNNDGRLFFLRRRNLDRRNEVVEFRIRGGAGLGMFLLGFGQDADGEIYVLANNTGVPFGDTGVVMRLAPR